MPQETSNVMSTYEIIATVIAVIALIQPWAIKLWNTLFKKLKITFIPSGKFKLFYNRSGAYVQIGGVIEAKNQSVVVRDISAKITRLSDNAELKLDWSSFNTPVFQNVAGNIVTTTETARPFKVKANDLSPIFVEFANIDDIFLNQLAEIHNSLMGRARSLDPLFRWRMHDIISGQLLSIKRPKKSCSKVFTGRSHNTFLGFLYIMETTQ